MRISKPTKQKFLRIQFYYISLWLLFVLSAIGTLKIFNENGTFIGLKNLIPYNVLPIIFVAFSIVSLILLLNVRHKLKGTVNPSHTIKSVKNENYEIMTFVATYIVPLACINLLDFKYFIIFILLIIVLGIITAKMNLYMANPTLSLFGYKLYSVEVSDPKSPGEYIVISRDELVVGDKIEWISLDQKRWYVRKGK